ncbi:MAG: uncharacterized protein KVP18_001912 [Porospora cf. gigantea A]|nr:MAG: hypothetical protein KVP18_001912 [Porospora cf. gigantea A]
MLTRSLRRKAIIAVDGLMNDPAATPHRLQLESVKTKLNDGGFATLSAVVDDCEKVCNHTE